VSAAGRLPLPGFDAPFSRSEREATAFAEWFCAGGLGSYKLDERSLELFSGLHYCRKRKTWMARFVPPRGKKSALKYREATYTEVLAFARLLNDGRLKPTESVRALTAFEIKFDREAAKLRFPKPQ